MKGRIDRLDYHVESGEVLVWDYKSGAIPTAVSIFERLEECQLPSYLAAVKQGLVKVEEPLEIAGLRAGFIGLKSIRKEHLKASGFRQGHRSMGGSAPGLGGSHAAVARRLKTGDPP